MEFQSHSKGDILFVYIFRQIPLSCSKNLFEGHSGIVLAASKFRQVTPIK